MAEIMPSVAQVTFRAQQDGERVLINVQHRDEPDIPVLRYGYLRFDMAAGVMLGEAEEIAALLNDKVKSLIYIGQDPEDVPAEKVPLTDRL